MHFAAAQDTLHLEFDLQSNQGALGARHAQVRTLGLDSDCNPIPDFDLGLWRRPVVPPVRTSKPIKRLAIRLGADDDLAVQDGLVSLRAGLRDKQIDHHRRFCIGNHDTGRGQGQKDWHYGAIIDSAITSNE